jgi:hypothetical protein
MTGRRASHILDLVRRRILPGNSEILTRTEKDASTPRLDEEVQRALVREAISMARWTLPAIDDIYAGNV